MAMSSGDYGLLFDTLGSLVQAIYRSVAMTGKNTPLGEAQRWNWERNFSNPSAGHFTIIGTNSDRYDVIEGLYTFVEAQKDQQSRMADQLSAFCDTALIGPQSPATSGLPLPPNAGLQDYLKELLRSMYTFSGGMNVVENTVSFGTPSADAANSGNGVLLQTGYLDQVTPPNPGFPAFDVYDDVLSELASTAETITVTCTRDEPNNGTPEGEEIFQLQGQSPGARFEWDNLNDGSGANLTLPSLKSYQTITNKDFESWTSDVPTGWTLQSGTAGTHVIEESSASEVYIGTRALKIAGDGSTATISLDVPIGQGVLTPGKMYRLSCYVKGDASIVAGALEISFTGTGYTAGSTTTGGVAEQISMNAAALAAQTSYGEEGYWFIAPDIIPDDFKLRIHVTGTLTNGTFIRVANLMLGPAIYANGAGWAVVPGNTQFSRGDRFQTNMSNDDVGVFQTFFRQKWGVQLPSAAAATAAVADTKTAVLTPVV